MPSKPGRLGFARERPEPQLWALALAASIATFQAGPAVSARGGATAALCLGLVLVLELLAGLYRPAASVGLVTLGVPLALVILGGGWGPIAVALGSGLSQLAFDSARGEASARPAFGAAARALLGATAAFWSVELASQRDISSALGAALAGGGAWLVSTRLVDAWLGVAFRFPRGWWVRGLLEAAGWGLGVAFISGPSPIDGAAVVLALAVAASWAEAGRHALAAERARVRESDLLSKAAADPTTGLVETGLWRQELNRLFHRSRLEGSHLTVAIFDLDHLRRTNSQGGFGLGDERLHELAVRLPAGPACGRWLGGSAIWALAETSGDAALLRVEALRAAFDDDLRGSISCGLASTSELTTHRAEDLLALAEAAVQVAKDEGRRCSLLDLGGGRYRDPAGALVVVSATTDEDDSEGTAAPPFFA